MPIKLYDYQLDAITKMHNGCILCGGVGSGKSRTALSYFYLKNGGTLESLQGNSYMHMKDPKDLIIITTARKRDTFEWEQEMSVFLMSPENGISPYGNRVIVDSWNNIKKYQDFTGCFFIFDEQRVVGSGAWVKSFLKICKSNEWILLSATPGDTWMDYIPVFIANGFYKNRTAFTQEHVVYRRFSKYPQVERYTNTGRLIRLRNQVLVDMDFERETVSHHIDIFSNYDVLKYKTITKTRWNPWKDDPIESASELCYALRRIVNSDESRQASLLEIFENHPKLIVFYNFDYELDILKEIFKASNNGTDVAEWNGHKHEPIPESDSWVYLVQYNAGAEGWNCIRTDTIVFYSQNYSYKIMQQAAGRIDRLNTPFRELYYYHIKSKAPIDIGISRALKAKKNFNERRFVDGTY